MQSLSHSDSDNDDSGGSDVQRKHKKPAHKDGDLLSISAGMDA